MARSPHRSVALALAAGLVLGGCVARGEVVDPSPTATPSNQPTATPTTEPVIGYAVLADDPSALAQGRVRAGLEGRQLLVIAGVPSPADREVMRSLDELHVLATEDADRARLGRSAAMSVTVTEVEISPAHAGLADLALTTLHDAPGTFTGEIRLVDTIDPSIAADAAEDLVAGDLLVAFDGDIRADGPHLESLRVALAAGVPVLAMDGFDIPLDWRLDVLAAGLEVPGGGQLLAGRRYIAAYGTPGTRSLGVLGEQGVEEAHQRIMDIAEPYDDGTMSIIPVFEIIAAVASASATDDGDYSYRIGFDLIREWVDYAAENDILVILDIQPGRTDFLTHAKKYEQFLVQPHVGLALDPEWRLKPNQVHLRQVGTVDGAEINQVVDWLSDLVRQHDLPQKMLIMHQFKTSMITNREIVKSPDELYVVLHMDGQGGQPAKDSTYDTLIKPGQPWAPGWKNFYDEDRPMAGAEKVLGLDPQPVFISFQ